MTAIIRPTTVISVRGKHRAALLGDPANVYVGRACAGWPMSPWGNPFKVRKKPTPLFELLCNPDERLCSTAEEAVRKFKDFVERGGLAHPPFNFVMRDRLEELAGKVLMCWCCEWTPGQPVVRPCHAIALSQLADASRKD